VAAGGSPTSLRMNMTDGPETVDGGSAGSTEPRRFRSRGFHLFTYGTLQRGQEGASLLEGCVRIGPATVQGSLYDIDGEYPALVLAGKGRVEGEIWRCPPEVLARLDEYEGVSEGLFRRVATEAGGLACWVYVAGPKLARRLTPRRRIPSGRWPPEEKIED